ncbi:MAG: hypothetical protein ACRCXB_30125 [Aeromonadaceae bacterium]
MKTVTHPVITEVIANTGLSWPKAVAWCDANLLPAWRTGLPVVAGIIEIEDGESEE